MGKTNFVPVLLIVTLLVAACGTAVISTPAAGSTVEPATVVPLPTIVPVQVTVEPMPEMAVLDHGQQYSSGSINVVYDSHNQLDVSTEVVAGILGGMNWQLDTLDVWLIGPNDPNGGMGGQGFASRQYVDGAPVNGGTIGLDCSNADLTACNQMFYTQFMSLASQFSRSDSTPLLDFTTFKVIVAAP